MDRRVGYMLARLRRCLLGYWWLIVTTDHSSKCFRFFQRTSYARAVLAIVEVSIRHALVLCQNDQS